MSKRYYVTLPDGVGEKLERWAASEKDKPATLAAFLLTKAIREADEKGLIPETMPKKAEGTSDNKE